MRKMWNALEDRVVNSTQNEFRRVIMCDELFNFLCANGDACVGILFKFISFHLS
jgi:hypothetical protein